MKILVTGASGFIARNIIEQLKSGYTIIPCNSAELNLLDSDKVFDFIKTGKFDVVIHTATYDAAPKHSTKDPSKVLEYNLRMFFNLARCKDYFGKMIYFGSGAEFSREYWVPKMKEDYFDRHVPQDQYGFSKYIMNKFARLSENIYNFRLFAVFGKYDDYRVRFVSYACAAAALSLPITIEKNVSFDYLYIDDLVNITEWFINKSPREKDYNVCTCRVYDHLTLAKKVLKICGKDLEVIVKEDSPGIEYSGDNSRLMNEVGEYSFKDIDDSIKEIYSWYSANKNIIDKEYLC
ncbi:MAG: NAD(P)-dependent oxidoreductase [Candidatus Omnitrophota bacterium]